VSAQGLQKTKTPLEFSGLALIEANSLNSGGVAVRPDLEPADGNQLWLLLSPLHGVCQLVGLKITVLFQLIRKIHGNACGLRGQISSRKPLNYCAVHKRAQELGGGKW
jgi:hypothetical protein